jgi:hypothetical protein
VSAQERMRRTASQLLTRGVDPYNTIEELERQAEQLADFAEWVRETREEESCSLLRRQAG